MVDLIVQTFWNFEKCWVCSYNIARFRNQCSFTFVATKRRLYARLTLLRAHIIAILCLGYMWNHQTDLTCLVSLWQIWAWFTGGHWWGMCPPSGGGFKFGEGVDGEFLLWSWFVGDSTGRIFGGWRECDAGDFLLICEFPMMVCRKVCLFWLIFWYYPLIICVPSYYTPWMHVSTTIKWGQRNNFGLMGVCNGRLLGEITGDGK